MEKSTLKRLTLNELAEIMPIVSASEQEDSVGGAHVYGSDGTYLSNTYNTSDPTSIYFMRPDNTYNYGGIPVYVYSSATPMSLNQATSSERFNVVDTMAQSIGINNLQFLNVPNGIYGSCSPSGVISFNVASGYFSTGPVNYNNIMLTLIHERHHALTLSDHGTNQDEIEAINAMMASPYWNDASWDNKARIEYNLNQHKLQQQMGYY